jgi:hypothetical protein
MKPILALCLAATLFAGPVPEAPMPVPQPPPQTQTQIQTQPQSQKLVKKSGKKKWIIITAVAAAATIATIAAVNPRLANEGRGIF